LKVKPTLLPIFFFSTQHEAQQAKMYQQEASNGATTMKM
jgi:hypothetical protein